jgi:sigma-B regulation protein RsbU (phosphoserine phosphatase)
MLPAFMPDTANVSFSSGYFPAERLSGDFFDIFRIDDQHIGLCICDVSGHGVPAAMLTVFLKQTIESRMEIDRSTGNVSFPSTVLKNIYDSFNHSSFKDDVYMVLIYAIYNEATKRLIYSSAGLNTPPVLMGTDRKVTEINISGFPICKFSEILEVEYTDSFLELKSRDKLLFYTDGFVDAQNNDRDRYSSERLKTVLEENAGLDCKTLSGILIEDLNSFTQGCSIKDDVTFFIMEVN